MTETKMEVIKLMPKEYTQAEADAFKHGFFLGAKFERNELIQEAVEWLKEHKEAVETEDNGIMGWIPDYFIEDFKKYMKGE
jgi:hypothetical protein